MKNRLSAAAVAVALLLTLAAPARAADYTRLADELHGVGVFKGTDASYELDAAAIEFPGNLNTYVDVTKTMSAE